MLTRAPYDPFTDKRPATLAITAPSAWASYLINGDATGLCMQDIEQADSWIERQGVGLPVACEDAGFMWKHDAFTECPLGADCQTYLFIIREEESN